MKAIVFCVLIVALSCQLIPLDSRFTTQNSPIDIPFIPQRYTQIDAICKKMTNLLILTNSQLYELLASIEMNKYSLSNLYSFYKKQVQDAILNISNKTKVTQMKAELKKFFGKSNSWVKYMDQGGIYVDIDISSLGLANPPHVQTFLTSPGGSIWQLTGANAIYNLTNKSFRVFLSHPVTPKFASVQNAVKFGWTLNYQIISLD